MSRSIELSFIKPLPRYETEKPFFVSQMTHADFPDGFLTNLEYERKGSIRIVDARTCNMDEFSYHEQSFKFIKHVSSCTAGTEPDAIRAYSETMTQFVKEEFSADRAICYDFRTRKNTDNPNYAASKDNDRKVAAPPVTAVHIDHTRQGGFHRVRRHLTEEEAVTYLSGQYRIRIINVWRPLNQIIEDCPLALCDSRSLHMDDLIAADRVSPDYVGEIYYVKHTPQQKWYWLSRQTPDEISVFVSFDSDCAQRKTGINFCAHAAFNDPSASSSAPPRESVEVRVIIFNKIDKSPPSYSG